MASGRIGGALAAAATPLVDGGARLDEDGFAALLEFYEARGLDGVLVLGTTGEGILLSAPERRRAAEVAVASARVLPVMVHCGAQSTAETVALAAHSAEIGADAVAVIAPPYFALAEGELVEHFAAAAAACLPLPFYLYEYADRSGYAIPVSVVERLRDRTPNLVGIKVSDAPFERVEPYLATGLDIFVGAEALLRTGIEHGAAGAMSGVAAVFPEAVSALVRDPTDERDALLRSLRSALSAHPLQAAVKAALGFRGLPVGPDVRAPLQPLAAEPAAQLRAELERLLPAGMLAPAVGA